MRSGSALKYTSFHANSSSVQDELVQSPLSTLNTQRTRLDCGKILHPDFQFKDKLSEERQPSSTVAEPVSRQIRIYFTGISNRPELPQSSLALADTPGGIPEPFLS